MKKGIFLCLIVFIFLLLSSQLQAAWFGNGTPRCDECEIASLQGEDASVVNGASSFLQSYSQFLILLNQSELSTNGYFNFNTAQAALSNSIDYLNKAKSFYLDYVICLNNSTQDENFTKTLSNIDTKVIVVEFHLHSNIMEKVSSLIANGDVRPLFLMYIDEMDKLLLLLSIVESELKNGKIPAIFSLRCLYQNYSDLMNYGYYSSLVLAEVRRLNE